MIRVNHFCAEAKISFGGAKTLNLAVGLFGGVGVDPVPVLGGRIFYEALAPVGHF